MSLDAWFTLGWILWFAMFAVVETLAVIMDKHKSIGDTDNDGVYDDGFTLSEHLRRWFSVKTAKGRTVFLVAFMIFAGSFVLHINSGSWIG